MRKVVMVAVRVLTSESRRRRAQIDATANDHFSAYARVGGSLAKLKD